MERTVTIREAAGLLGAEPKNLRNEFQRVLPRPTPVRGRSSGPRKLGLGELVYFHVMNALRAEGFEIHPALRPDLYSVLTDASRRSAGPWLMDEMLLKFRGKVPVEIPIEPLKQEVKSMLEQYFAGSELTESREDVLGGEPVFSGTRIPVQQVVALFQRGLSAEAIATDYPTLSAEALEYARLKARIGNGPGRPRKPLEVRRVTA